MYSAAIAGAIVAGTAALPGMLTERMRTGSAFLVAEPAADDVALEGTLLGKERLKPIGYRWCRSWAGCHVGRIEIGFNVALGGAETQWLRRVDDHVFPTCK